MKRKMIARVVAAICTVVAGFAVFAQQHQRGPEWDNFKPVKAGKKWHYCTLTEAKLDNKGRVAVIVEGASLTGVCNGGWIEAAEKLGQKFGPDYPRNNDGGRGRHIALDQMGEMGWELISTHQGDRERTVWVFKREK